MEKAFKRIGISACYKRELDVSFYDSLNVKRHNYFILRLKTRSNKSQMLLTEYKRIKDFGTPKHVILD